MLASFYAPLGEKYLQSAVGYFYHAARSLSIRVRHFPFSVFALRA